MTPASRDALWGSALCGAAWHSVGAYYRIFHPSTRITFGGVHLMDPVYCEARFRIHPLYPVIPPASFLSLLHMERNKSWPNATSVTHCYRILSHVTLEIDECSDTGSSLLTCRVTFFSHPFYFSLTCEGQNIPLGFALHFSRAC